MPITDHQRNARARYLGSSDAPRVLEVSPWGGPPDVYWEKVAPSERDEPTEAMQMGNRLEGPTLDYAADELGLKLICNQFRVAADKVLAANLDALVVGESRAVEAKYIGPDNLDQWGEAETDQVPVYVVAQTQHQMHVASLEEVIVAAFFAGFRPEWRLYFVPRKQEIIDVMVERELTFWRDHVLPKLPPIGGELPPLEVLKRLRREPESMVELGGNAQLLIDILESSKDLERQVKGDVRDAQRALIDALGDAEAGTLPDGRMVTYLEQTRKGHTVEATTFRVLKIKKPKGGET